MTGRDGQTRRDDGKMQQPVGKAEGQKRWKATPLACVSLIKLSAHFVSKLQQSLVGIASVHKPLRALCRACSSSAHCATTSSPSSSLCSNRTGKAPCEVLLLHLSSLAPSPWIKPRLLSSHIPSYYLSIIHSSGSSIHLHRHLPLYHLFDSSHYIAYPISTD